MYLIMLTQLMDMLINSFEYIEFEESRRTKSKR